MSDGAWGVPPIEVPEVGSPVVRWVAVELVTTSAARAVVKGTEATRPMDPRRVRTISAATISLVAVSPICCPPIRNRTSSGMLAPA